MTLRLVLALATDRWCRLIFVLGALQFLLDDVGGGSLAFPLILITGAYTARSDVSPALVKLSKNIHASKAGNHISMTTSCQQNSTMRFLQLGRVAMISRLHLWNMLYATVPLMANKLKETEFKISTKPGFVIIEAAMWHY